MTETKTVVDDFRRQAVSALEILAHTRKLVVPGIEPPTVERTSCGAEMTVRELGIEIVFSLRILGRPCPKLHEHAGRCDVCGDGNVIVRVEGGMRWPGSGVASDYTIEQAELIGEIAWSCRKFTTALPKLIATTAALARST